ncbi:unnamed protein product [Sphenostylis stenocarpa]|uniref:GBF-interacting protein 1 N-terminal domain-containing protein n=1 Tax=Sphenostylis stenocarpa TaxID=92480 RepID=A0AA86VRK1_9FABA|nr:unnamed protein product [Sphenostylis stenocarpa]
MSSAGFRASIPTSVRRTIQNIKEITGNHSEEDIYAMLKECSMDPNETAQKLLLQDSQSSHGFSMLCAVCKASLEIGLLAVFFYLGVASLDVFRIAATMILVTLWLTIVVHNATKRDDHYFQDIVRATVFGRSSERIWDKGKAIASGICVGLLHFEKEKPGTSAFGRPSRLVHLGKHRVQCIKVKAEASTSKASTFRVLGKCQPMHLELSQYSDALGLSFLLKKYGTFAEVNASGKMLESMLLDQSWGQWI